MTMATLKNVLHSGHPIPSINYIFTPNRFSFSSVAFRHIPLRLRSLSAASNHVDILPHSSDVSLLDMCCNHVPHDVLQRASEAGLVVPTDFQREALPTMLSGRDCVLHSQTGSGKTLAYLLSIFAIVNPQNPAVQALIVVPTRELGIQVAKVARTLASKKYPVMALLEGGTLKRHKTWLKADPPTIVVATIGCLSEMIEKHIFTLNSLQVLVIDEVDFIFNSSKQTSSLKNLLGLHSSCNNRQTILVSASIPQHKRFLHDCAQHKWTKRDVVHIHRDSFNPMPSSLCHRFIVCNKGEKHRTLLSLLLSDKPTSAFVFLNEQSEKSKRAGDVPQTQIMMEFLKGYYKDGADVALLGEEVGFNQRAASFLELRGGGGGGFLLVATDIASRGVDLPDTSHVYNFELPDTAVGYLHRAGRSGRKPFSDEKSFVTSVICADERFVLQRFENELMFQCKEIMLNER